MRTHAQRLDLSDRCADEPTPVPSPEGNSLAVSCDTLPSLGGECLPFSRRFCEGRTSNIQHPTPNIEQGARQWPIGSWMLDVRCWMFFCYSVPAEPGWELSPGPN